MFANPLERRKSRGKKGPTMAAKPRRPRPNMSRLDTSSSEDSVIGPLSRPKVVASVESYSDRARSGLGRLQIRGKVHLLKKPPEPYLNELLKNRELGKSFGRSHRRLIQSHIQDSIYNNPLRRIGGWVGASGDVLVAAWSSNGFKYAFGCSTDLDATSAQYNRRNNLLFGNITPPKIFELPDHYVDRAEAIQTSRNTATTASTLDPELYTTITSLAFDKTSDYLYTASYDKTVKVWDTQGEGPKILNTLVHNAMVTHLISSSTYGNTFVTGQSTQKGSIRVYTKHTLNQALFYLESAKAQKSREQIFPSTLQLGTEQMAHYLLAGFAGNNPDPTAEDKHGDICLWDLNTCKLLKIRGNSQTVFDASWHSQSRLFAAATKPGNRSLLGNKWKTKTLVRLWQPLNLPSIIQEYECPALDINEVQFHPWDQNLVVASCTDGASYIWDCRMGDEVLHKLQHGKPIDEARYGQTREEYDTGVRMAVWSQDGKRLMTGASDGVIKSWDVFASPEDASEGDAASFTSGVMCGTWSPDYRNLLVGLAQGAVELLTSDPVDDEDDSTSSVDKEIEFIPAKLPKAQTLAEDDSGVAASRALLASQQLIMHPIYGAGKGPNYSGPYAAYAHRLDAAGNCDLDNLLPQIAVLQLDEETRRQARRDGGERVRSVKKFERKRYKNAETLARARNVAMLGKQVEDREVIYLGKRERGREEKEEGHRMSRGRGKEEGRRKKGSTVVKKGSLILCDEEDSWEDPLEEDYWF